MQKGFLTIYILFFFLFMSCEPASPNQSRSLKNIFEKENKTTTTPEYGGTAKLIIPQKLDSLDPHEAQAAGSHEILFNVFEGLYKPNEKAEIIPAIAVDYPKVSADGLTYTIQLKSNILFHNGEKVTPQDIKYSLERIKSQSSKYQIIKSVTVSEDSTVVISLSQVDVAFFPKLTIAILPQSNDGKHHTNPVGTGPFQLQEYKPGRKISLKKFPNYWQKELPYLDGVEFQVISDKQAAFARFLAGQIDIYPRIDIEFLTSLTEETKVFKSNQNMVQLMAMNHQKKPLADLQVRKAIQHAIDKDSIIQNLASGLAAKLGSNMSPAMPQYYQENLENQYQHNIEKAKQILQKTSYAKGFKISLTVPSNYKLHMDTAQIIAFQLSKIGIEVDIKPVEWGVWLKEVYNNREYEMTIIGLTGKLDPHDILIRYHSDYRKNFFQYKNEEYDKLLNQASVELNEEKRITLYKQAQKLLAEDAAAVYIMDPNYVVAMKNNLFGYKLYPLYIQDLSTVFYAKQKEK